MKKLQILIIAFLLSLSIFAFVSMQAKAANAPISLSVNSGYVGDSVTVSANSGFGPGSGVTITIKFDDVALNTSPSPVTTNGLGGFTAIFTVPTATPGTHTVTATDSNSNTGSITFTVYAPPVVAVSPTSWSMDVNQSKTFVASASGGSGTYSSYQWYVGSSIQSGATASTFNYSPTSAGSYSILVTVTDSLGKTSAQSSPAASVTVNSALVAPTVSASASTINQGQNCSLSSVAVSTGTGPYTYQWLEKVPGASSYSLISGAISSTYSFITSSSTTTGSWGFELQVTDSASEVVISTSVSVIVNAVPIVNVTPISWTMDVGQSLTFTATPSGGSGSYPSTGYKWYVGGVVQSGQTASTFSYSPTSAGAFLITVTVTDSQGGTSAISSAATVTVNASPTVSIAPIGPLTLGFAQVQSFTATPSGGSGTLSYQWYLDGIAVGNIATYSYTAVAGSHQVYVNVTDNASAPYMVKSNVVSITVNSALAPPTVSASVSSVKQGETCSLSSVAVSTGTGPYTYQWLEKVPGASSYSPISGATSTSYSFVTADSTIPGVWSFKLNVTDAALAVVTSNSVLVTVNSAPLDHFVFSSVGNQIAGTSFSITITAMDALNNTLTNYSGTNNLNVSTGTISPSSTGAFSNGVWSGSVTVTKAGSGIWLFTSVSGMSGTSSSFTVNPSVLDHFTFSTVSDQTVGSAFTITVTAEDAFNNAVTDYVGTPSLTVSAGSINPQTMPAFVSGVGSTSITINNAGSSLTITATDGTHTGGSNPFTITLNPTPTPTSSPTQTSTPTLSPTTKPTTTPASSSIIAPFVTTVPAITDNGTTINLEIRSNTNSSQISSATIITNQTIKTTIVSFTITGPDGLSIFNNVTIPKNAISYGTIPVVLVDDQYASNQGYAQDANNFYVWYETQFSTHQVKIQFAASSSLQLPISPVVIVGVIVTEIVLIYTAIAVRRLRRKPGNE